MKHRSHYPVVFLAVVFQGLLFTLTACNDAVLYPFSSIDSDSGELLPLPAHCLADDLTHDGTVALGGQVRAVEDWKTCPCLVGEDSGLDPDGDGVPSACDPCPTDNPDDADGDGLCDPNPTCWADYNGDGVVDALDHTRVIACWGQVTDQSCATTDFDGNGVVGSPEFDAINDCWGACPASPGQCFDAYES